MAPPSNTDLHPQVIPTWAVFGFGVYNLGINHVGTFYVVYTHMQLFSWYEMIIYKLT